MASNENPRLSIVHENVPEQLVHPSVLAEFQGRIVDLTTESPETERYIESVFYGHSRYLLPPGTGREIQVQRYVDDGLNYYAAELTKHYGIDTRGAGALGFVNMAVEPEHAPHSSRLDFQTYLLSDGRVVSVLSMFAEKISKLRRPETSKECFDLADSMGLGRTWFDFTQAAFVEQDEAKGRIGSFSQDVVVDLDTEKVRKILQELAQYK